MIMSLFVYLSEHQHIIGVDWVGAHALEKPHRVECNQELLLKGAK